MLSPRLRQDVFDLWSKFWSSGISNPLVAIEQITYLLFLRHLERLDDQRVRDGKRSIYAGGFEDCKWSYIKQAPTYELLNDTVFKWLRGLSGAVFQAGDEAAAGDDEAIEAAVGDADRIMADAYFQLPREKTAILTESIAIIDRLFENDSNPDLMGDIFEYLLQEIKQAGKNGQFRTPRQIIRFMVELINPQPGEHVIDPAAGTDGFLFTTIQHLLKAITPPEDLRLEWDGTPHRLAGYGESELLKSEYFTGFDNDRTMVRIGWMNMILHGIENPRVQRRDSLGKGLEAEHSGAYDVVLANPPFTGNVDTDDLHETRFPRKPGKKNEAITNKSELLFLWLILDLLKLGGRAAVVVPEGVLFGSTGAHKQLRRELLFEHDLRAVISLPGGVFQPYAGVKTSILVFHKRGEKIAPGQPPYTKNVWFYEVLADGYTLDAKRTDAPEANDLPDALMKFRERDKTADYFHPRLYAERWRVVDKMTTELYPDLVAESGKVWGIHELFTELSPDPKQATQQVIAAQQKAIAALYERYIEACLGIISDALMTGGSAAKARNTAMVRAGECLNNLHRMFTAALRDKTKFDTEYNKYGRDALNAVWNEAKPPTDAWLEPWVERAYSAPAASTPDLKPWQAEVDAIVREFAKLDGYNILLRTPEVFAVPENERPYTENRCWSASVREYARNDEWQNADGTVTGTHDENGEVRLAYIDYLKAEDKFNDDGSLNDVSVLEPTCIEANDFNLSAGRYKPFAQVQTAYDPPAEIIEALRARELKIVSGLDELTRDDGGARCLMCPRHGFLCRLETSACRQNLSTQEEALKRPSDT